MLLYINTEGATSKFQNKKQNPEMEKSELI